MIREDTDPATAPVVRASGVGMKPLAPLSMNKIAPVAISCHGLAASQMHGAEQSTRVMTCASGHFSTSICFVFCLECRHTSRHRMA
jgi:hypothetical protein